MLQHVTVFLLQNSFVRTFNHLVNLIYSKMLCYDMPKIDCLHFKNRKLKRKTINHVRIFKKQNTSEIMDLVLVYIKNKKVYNYELQLVDRTKTA